MKNEKKFDPSKLIVKREEAVYPHTYYIKKKYIKNPDEDAEFITVTTDTIVMLLTHWVLTSKLESPVTMSINIGIGKNIGYNGITNRERKILNSIEESIDEDNSYITMDFVRKYFNILHHIIRGFATAEPYCRELYHKIHKKMQINGYDVEYDFDKNSMLIHTVFGDIEEESLDVKGLVAQYDTDLKLSSSVNY